MRQDPQDHILLGDASEQGHRLLDDLIVTDTELRVVLAPLSSARRSRAIAAVCEQLNLTATGFPCTRLVLRSEVE